MSTILELKDKRQILVEKNKSLVSTGKQEIRKLTDVENTAFEANHKEIEALDTEIRTAETVDKKELRNTNIEIKPKTMSLRTPFLTAINNKVNNRAHSDELSKVFQAGEAEMRKSGLSFGSDILFPMNIEQRADILAGTTNAGEEIVREDKLDIIGPLMANMVLVQAGAQFITGLVGDVSIPSYSGTSVAWKGEVVTAADGGGTFDEVNLSPKRLTAMVDVSKQFLLQDSAGAEALLKSNITQAIAAKLEETIFGEHATDAAMPDGFFTGYDNSSTPYEGSVSWANIVGPETTIAAANALRGKMAYITCPTAVGLLKTTKKGSTSDDIMLMGNDFTLNGYKVLSTSSVVSSLTEGTVTLEAGIVLGNWMDYIIGQWGSIEILVDPYTQAATGQIRIVVNAYFDAKVGRSASFHAFSIKA